MKRSTTMAKTAQVVAETPKVEAEVTTTATEQPKRQPLGNRVFTLVAQPSLPPKGKQRQICLRILVEAGEAGTTIQAAAKKAKEYELSTVDTIENSVKYHFHHLVLLGLAAESTPVDPTINEAK